MVLDISLDKNRDALLGLLERGVRVRYFDHHFPGAIPEHPGLDVHIETLPHKGTNLLVDDFLGGRCRAWAGDNFEAAARWAAAPLGLAEAQLATLRELGVCLNYNAYGARLEDLYFAPDELFRRLRPYADPFAFIAADPAFGTLRAGYAEDYGAGTGLETGARGRPAMPSISCPLSPGRGTRVGSWPTSSPRHPRSALTPC